MSSLQWIMLGLGLCVIAYLIYKVGVSKPDEDVVVGGEDVSESETAQYYTSDLPPVQVPVTEDTLGPEVISSADFADVKKYLPPDATSVVPVVIAPTGPTGSTNVTLGGVTPTGPTSPSKRRRSGGKKTGSGVKTQATGQKKPKVNRSKKTV